MVKFTKQFSINNFCLLSILLLGSLYVSENAYSQKYWNKEFTQVTYDPSENSILIKFEVFDYYFGPTYENAYLESCDFFYTTNGRTYTKLMKAETAKQRVRDFTKLKMRCKYIDTELHFMGCYNTEYDRIWPDDIKAVTVKVKNEVKGHFTYEKNNKKIIVDKYIAFFTVKWILGENFNNVKRIRLNGWWKVDGLKRDYFKDIYYDITGRGLLKSTVNQAEKNQVKVATQADAIVIKGAENGENIKVYNTTGVEVQSTVKNSDVINLKLPKNQIYFVNVGEARYKVVI